MPWRRVLLLALTGYLFWTASFTVTTHLLAWSSIFFFASAGASAAYLTVSEIFPMEIRAMAIAFFFMVAQGAGIIAPWLYGQSIETSVTSVFYGYLLGAGLMLVGAVVELMLGVKAEGRRWNRSPLRYRHTRSQRIRRPPPDPLLILDAPWGELPARTVSIS